MRRDKSPRAAVGERPRRQWSRPGLLGARVRTHAARHIKSPRGLWPAAATVIASGRPGLVALWPLGACWRRKAGARKTTPPSRRLPRPTPARAGRSAAARLWRRRPTAPVRRQDAMCVAWWNERSLSRSFGPGRKSGHSGCWVPGPRTTYEGPSRVSVHIVILQGQTCRPAIWGLRRGAPCTRARVLAPWPSRLAGLLRIGCKRTAVKIGLP
jgi:hypothetical protein